MVTKKKSADQEKAKKSHVKVGKLKLNKETVKNLTSGASKKFKGGQRPARPIDTAASHQDVCCA